VSSGYEECSWIAGQNPTRERQLNMGHTQYHTPNLLFVVQTYGAFELRLSPIAIFRCPKLRTHFK
jgi:hypothetical protein